MSAPQPNPPSRPAWPNPSAFSKLHWDQVGQGTPGAKPATPPTVVKPVTGTGTITAPRPSAPAPRPAPSQKAPAAKPAANAPASSPAKSQHAPTPARPPASTGKPASQIRTEGLVKTYGTRNVVDGINLHINAGEILGLLGPNGAGKTTTFYMIVGLVPATAGSVTLDGVDLTHAKMHERARHGIGYLPQEASIFRKLTVRQNILAIAESVGIPRRERAACVKKHLEELHLSHVADQKAFTLSGGERRRLEIARALVIQPKFLLLDEPFAAIDPISVAEVQKLVVELRSRGIGIIITDHNVRETLRIVDRAYCIKDGKVLFEGTSADLIANPKVRESYLGENFDR